MGEHEKREPAPKGPVPKGIEVLSAEKRVFSPRPEISAGAHIKSLAEYQRIYKRSVEDPEGFWAEMAEKNIHWFRKWDKVLR